MSFKTPEIALKTAAVVMVSGERFSDNMLKAFIDNATEYLERRKKKASPIPQINNAIDKAKKLLIKNKTVTP